MAPRKGRSPVAANVTQQSLALATSALAELPEKPKTNYSLREAISQLQGVINTALDRGYTHQEIAEMLAGQGIRISPASLKSYLAASNREASATPKRRRTSTKKAKTEEAVAASAAAPSAEGSAEIEAAPKKTRGKKAASPDQELAKPKAETGSRRGRAAAKTKAAEEVTTQVESAPEAEAAPKKTRGPRTASKAKTPAPTRGRKPASASTGTRRKRSAS